VHFGEKGLTKDNREILRNAMNAYKKSRINHQIMPDGNHLNVKDKNTVVGLSCSVVGNMPGCIASKTK